MTQQLLFEDAGYSGPITSLADLREVRFVSCNDSYVVAGPKSCSCGVSGCKHRVMVADLAKGGKGFRYLAKSGMHKEIRRGNVKDAVRWSRWVRLCCADKDLRRYLKGIIFEETRNLELFFTPRLSTEDMVIRLALSPKKWELPRRDAAFSHYIRAFHGKAPMRGIGPNRALCEAYRKFWTLKQHPERPEIVSEFCCTIAVTLGDADLHTRFPEIWGYAAQLLRRVEERTDDFYVAKVLSELVSGAWSDEEWKSTDSDAETRLQASIQANYESNEPPTVPVLADYVYDNHTRPGAALYARCLRDVRPNEPLPPKIDLRWSGMVRGVAWRTAAFAAHGEGYEKLAWEEVSLDSDLWKDVHRVDGYFYESLYKRAGLDHYVV